MRKEAVVISTVGQKVAAATVALAAVVSTSCSSWTPGVSQSSTPPTSAPAGAAIKATTAAADAFLDTLDAGQKKTVLFDWDDKEQKQRWSNFPAADSPRGGLEWGELDEAQRNAWLAVMKASLSDEGYQRVIAEWNADDAHAAQTGEWNLYGTKHYYVALIGVPSDSKPWMWQFDGHHLAINATLAGGRISLTPSFIGTQPARYTDAAGTIVRPLGDIEDDSFALMNSLDATQQQAAVLGSDPIDVVLGPGRDGKTLAAEGLALAQLNDAQKAAALKLIGHYTGMVDDADADTRLDEITSSIDQTYFAWYGPTTAGDAAYFRFTGPTLLIEYAPQPAGGGPGGGPGGRPPRGGQPRGPKPPQPGTPTDTAPTTKAIPDATIDHIHGIYRNPTNEYGAKYAP